MKKILAFVLACGMVFPCVSSIAQRSYVEGVYENDTLTVTYTEGEGDVATLTLFDEGKLCGVKTSKMVDGAYAFDVTETDKDKDIRIFYYEEKTYPVKITTPTPAPTEAPTQTPTPKPKKTPYPAAYEKPIDAINAPAIVSNVAKVGVEGEIVNELTLWQHGREVVTYVGDNVTIKSAPAAVNYLVGQDVMFLQAGDVVHLTCDIQGRVRTIEFIYRPDFADYYENGISTAGIVGNDGQSKLFFGAAVETYETLIELADGNGAIYDLDVSPDAFVYTVTPGSKKAIVDLYGTGAKLVPKAFVPKSNFGDKTVSWNGVTDIPYILVRASRDVVTDIIVFE